MSHFARTLRNRLLSVSVVAMAPVALLSILAVWNLAGRVDRLCQDEALLFAQAAKIRWPQWGQAVALPAPESLGLPQGSAMWVVLSGGAVMGEEALDWPDATLPGPALTGRIGQSAAASIPLDSPNARLVLKLPPERCNQRLYSVLGETSSLLALAILLSLGLAWAGMHRMVIRRLAQLERAARRISAGETGVRSGLNAETDEFGQLARTFDDMARAIDRRARDFKSSLLASESRFKHMARAAPTGIFRLDASFHLTYANPWCAELTGHSEASLMGKGWLLCIHPDDRPWVSDIIDRARARNQELDVRECRIRRPDGQILWVQIHDTLELDSLGRVAGRVATIINVTSQKRITEALRESEERFRKLARIAPVGIYRTNALGAFSYANDTLGAILGRPKYELKGRDWREFLHDPAECDFRRGEMRLLRPDGREVWVLVSEIVECDSQGEPIGRIGTMADITGQVLAREALRQSEERFRVALKHSPVSVMAYDTGLHCTWAFNGGPALIGRDDDEVLIDPEEAAQLMELKRVVMETRTGRREEVVCTFDGQQHTLDMWFEPLLAESGEVRGVVGAAVDMTGPRRLQSALIAAREEAERANAAKSRFLAAASHDLRQPFQAMRLFRAALTPFLTDRRAEIVAAKLDEAMTAGEQLLKTLLDVSTLEAGIIAAKCTDTCAASLIERLAREVQPQTEENGLRLHYMPFRAMVHTDPVLLERMLRNLLHNAVRYTEKGGVLIGARRRGNRLLFQVWDTGIGIAPDQQEKVFEDFYQVGNPGRDRSRGLGLGLSVVARMGRLLNHPVTLRSRPGHGTVFTVSVPLATEQRREAAA